MVEAPGSGIGEFAAAEPDDHVVITEHSMTNGLIAVSWNLDGEITSIIDVAHGREVLPPGRRVTVELAPDHPVEYDAWDLESWTGLLGSPMSPATSVEFGTSHPLMAQLVVRRKFGESELSQTYTMRAGSARLDITFDIDWHEDEKLLSVMIPLDVHARDAVCDIQFGNVDRPTHASNSWDAAKFEVCAHRFVDFSEPSFGVAVLNDGRYGHGVQDGGVRVSLLRASKYPDPAADHGRHTVTIGVLPHGAGLHEVLHEAEALNMPLRVVTGSATTAPAPVVTVDHRGVQISSVKQADDGSGDLIVRLYEACGDRATLTVRTPLLIGAAFRCNLLEEPQEGIECSDGIVALGLRPFELATLRLRPRSLPRQLTTAVAVVTGSDTVVEASLPPPQPPAAANNANTPTMRLRRVMAHSFADHHTAPPLPSRYRGKRPATGHTFHERRWLRAIAAYIAVPVTMACSSNITRLEWFGAAVARLRSRGVPPRKTIAPGTSWRT